MPRHERQKASHDFQYRNEINIIIGVAKALGTGLTLTRAKIVILMEQQGDPGIHEQEIGRALRKTNQTGTGPASMYSN
jgi:SNF2 family DNA or RNA helicase